MKKISISLDAIKASKGAVPVQTGLYSKVLPYYVRQLEDIAVEYFLKRMNDTSINNSESSENGGNNE